MKDKILNHINPYKDKPLKDIVEQLEKCNFMTPEGMLMTNNIAFIELKRRAENEEKGAGK